MYTYVLLMHGNNKYNNMTILKKGNRFPVNCKVLKNFLFEIIECSIKLHATYETVNIR
jgi:hypothetical protein